MFKKAFSLQSHSTLKSSATRSIREQVMTVFPAMTEQDVNLLFPNKALIGQDKVTTSAGAKVLIYYIDKERPLFIDISGGKGEPDLYPTVYCLWLLPHLLPPLYVHPQVSSFLLQGADLMLPGVLQPRGGYGQLLKGEKRCVIARGNPAPFAVGSLCIDSAHISHHGWTGRGLAITHCYGDTLWASGDKSIPNGGFHTHQIQSIITMEDVETALHAAIAAEGKEGENATHLQAMKLQLEKRKSETANTGSSHHEEKKEEEKKEEQITESSGIEQPSEPIQSAPAVDTPSVQTESSPNQVAEEEQDHNTENIADDSSTTAASSSQEEGGGSSNGGISAQMMDDSLYKSLLYSIKTNLHADNFPLTPSILLSSFMEAANPAVYRLDLKKSSYKKMNKFLKYAKKQGLLHLKETKTETIITGMNERHPEVKALVVDKDYQQTLKHKAKQQQQQQHQRMKEEGAEEEEDDENEEGWIKPEKTATLMVLQRYKPDAALRAALLKDESPAAATSADSATAAGLCEMKDIKQGLNSYIHKNGLTDGAHVKLDSTLSTLFSSNANDRLPRADLSQRLLSHLTLYHSIVLNGDVDHAKWSKGAAPLIEVSVEQRAGKKMMTHIVGLERYGIDPLQFAKEAQKLYASSATVGELLLGKHSTDHQAGKVKKEVLIQGNVSADIAESLQRLYHVATQYVHVKDLKAK